MPVDRFGVGAPVVLDEVHVAGVHSGEVEVHLRGATSEGLDVAHYRAVVQVCVHVERWQAGLARVPVVALHVHEPGDAGVDSELGVVPEVALRLVNVKVP